MNLRISRKVQNNISIALFLLIFLFLPKTTEFTRPFFAITLVSIPLFLGNTRKLYFDYLTIAGIAILILQAVFTVFRFGFIVDPNMRDYTEFARLMLPVLMLMFRDKFQDLSLYTLFAIFAIYTGADFLVSLLDFLGLDFLGIVSLTKSLFVSEAHARVAFRVDGLSPGPSQHGVTMLVMFTFFYCLLFKRERIFWPLFFSVIAAFPILLSQSRTSMIGFAAVSISIPLFYLVFGKQSSRRRAIPVLALLILGGGGALLYFQDFFSRLYALSEGLMAISSVRDRVEGYEALFNKAMEFPLFLFIGYGKEFFKTSVFDSEYIMMFLIYGPLVALVFVTSIFTYLINFILSKDKHRHLYSTILFFLLLGGLLIAIPSSYFLQPGILPLLFIFVNLSYWEFRLSGSILSEKNDSF